jgi:hypothetical protein
MCREQLIQLIKDKLGDDAVIVETSVLSILRHPLYEGNLTDCGVAGCKTCCYIGLGKPNPVFTVTCQVTNVIYVVGCLRCGLAYLGYTKGPLAKRFKSHRQKINTYHRKTSKQKADMGLHQHFSEKCGYDTLFINVFRSMPADAKENDLIKFENQMIRSCRTICPRGLNKIPSISQVRT